MNGILGIDFEGKKTINGLSYRKPFSPTERRLRMENQTDLLTGLPNDRALQKFLIGIEDAWTRSTIDEGGKKVRGSVIAIDLTGLKKVNDTFGRPSGDAYLMSVKDTVVHHLRKEDHFFRLGTEADEFTVFVPGMTEETQLQNLMDRFDKSLSERQDSARKENMGIEYSLSYVAVLYNATRGPKEAFEQGHIKMAESKKQKEKDTGKRGLSIGRTVIK